MPTSGFVRLPRKRRKKYYDDRSRMTRFHEGQKVWLYWPRLQVHQQFKKLTRLWTGQWKIVLFKSPVVIELHRVSNGAIQVVHVDWLLPCISLPPLVLRLMMSQMRTTSQTLLTKPRYQMRSFRMSLVCLRKAHCLSCKTLRPWVYKSQILRSWTLKTKILKSPGDPVVFESFQPL